MAVIGAIFVLAGIFTMIIASAIAVIAIMYADKGE